MPRYTHLSAPQMFMAYAAGAFGLGFLSMIGILVPLRAHEIGAPLEMIGLIVGANALAPALLSVPAGALADRIGPQKAFAIGAVFCGLVSLFYAFTANYWWMLVLQLVQGLGRGTAWVASQAYIAGVGSDEQQPAITGRFSFASNAGAFVGPLLAGISAQFFGYQASFLVTAAVALIFAAVGMVLPELRKEVARTAGIEGAPLPSTVRSVDKQSLAARRPHSAAGFTAALRLLGVRGIQITLLLTLMRVWILAGWMAFFPLFLANLGTPPAIIGTILAANAVLATITTLSSGYLVKAAPREVVCGLALALAAGGAALSPLLVEVPWVYLPAALIGIGSGISLPLLMSGMRDSARPEERGVALGLRTSANQVANTVAPPVLGLMVVVAGTGTAFALSAVFVWLGLALTLWLRQVGGGSLAASPSPPA